MIPLKIEARPEDDGFRSKGEPTIIPLPGVVRRPLREHTPPKPAAKEEIGPREILNALRYHSVLFVTLGTLTAGALATAAWMFVPAKYTTYAMVYVAQREPTILESRGAADSHSDFDIVLKTQASIINSTAIITGALNKPNIAQLGMVRAQANPVEYFETEIKPETAPNSQIIKVTLAGQDPNEITQFVNAVVDFYMEHEKDKNQYKQRSMDLLAKNKRELEQMRDEREKFLEQLMGFSPTNENMTARQRDRLFKFHTLQQDKQNIQMQLTMAREALKLTEEKLTQADAAPVVIPDMALRLEADRGINAKKGTIGRLDRSIADHVQRKSNPYDATYREMTAQLEQERATLQSMTAEFKTKQEQFMREAMKAKRTDNVEELRARVLGLEIAERANAEKLKDPEFKDIDVDTGAKPMSAEQRKAYDAFERYRLQVNQIESALTLQKVNLDSPERIQVYERAQVPTKREMKKQIALSGVAGLFGLGLVGGCISLGEIRRKRIYSPKDPLFHPSRLPLLGVIPEQGLVATGSNLARPAATDVAGRSFVEAVDKMRTVIGRQMSDRKMQILLVTSAAPDEGKSILAWNLALSCARSDRRTLFIDANLRNPGLHNHFEIASHPGLSEMLRAEKPIQQVVQRSTLDNLWCIAAGVCDDAARQALDKDGLRRLLDKARQDFDCVIIDSCSIEEAVDPLYIAQRADGTVLSLRTFSSRVDVTEKAVKRLGMVGAALLGAVLTDASGAADAI